MLPHLRAGYRYDEAVFLANLKAVLPAAVWNDRGRREHIEQGIAEVVRNYERNPYDKSDTKERRIAEWLRDQGIDTARCDRFYHPSMIEAYTQARPDKKGLLQLGVAAHGGRSQSDGHANVVPLARPVEPTAARG